VGLLVFLAVAQRDTEEDVQYIVSKVLNLRLFPSDKSYFDYSALEVKAELLVVSQFTLYGDTRKGRRPEFVAAAPPEEAERIYNRVVELFKASKLKVETGVFAAHMKVSLVNNGPVTLMIDSADRQRPRR
jgi:D-tyrosyl-tRNA(Tyr) deacylase